MPGIRTGRVKDAPCEFERLLVSVDTPVSSPGGLVSSGSVILSVRDRSDGSATDAVPGENSLDRCCTSLTQSVIILCSAPRVTVAFEAYVRHLSLAIALGVRLDRTALIGTYRRRVEVEVYRLKGAHLGLWLGLAHTVDAALPCRAVFVGAARI